MPDQSTHVFVSYSHADASLVAPIVKLIRINKSLVFQDIDDIQPGERWRTKIARGLAESHLVVVFWCDHANQSDEVKGVESRHRTRKGSLAPAIRFHSSTP